MSRIVPAQMMSQVIRHEGSRNTLYYDTVGNPSIGVGHNLRTPISTLAVNQILQDDLELAMRELEARFSWVRGLDDVRYFLLVEMAFNLGIGGLAGFEGMLGAIQLREFDIAATHMLQSEWARQVGPRAKEMAGQMSTGAWKGPGGEA